MVVLLPTLPTFLTSFVFKRSHPVSYNLFVVEGSSFSVSDVSSHLSPLEGSLVLVPTSLHDWFLNEVTVLSRIGKDGLV